MRCRKIGFGVMAAMVAASCGASTPDVTAGQSDALPVETTPEDDSQTPTTTGPLVIAELVDDAGLGIDDLLLGEIDLPTVTVDTSPLNNAVSVDDVPSYGYEISYFYGGAGEDGGDVEFSIDGVVDRTNGLGQWTIDAEGLASVGAMFTIHPDASEVFWVQDASSNRQAVYGLLNDSAQTGPPVWFDIGDAWDEAGQVFMPEATLSVDEMWLILNVERLAEYEIDGGLTRGIAEFVPSELLSATDGSALDTMSVSTVPVSLIVDYDDQGLIRDLVLHGSVDNDSAGDSDPHEVIFSLSMAYPGDVASIAEPVDAQPWNGAETQLSERPESSGPVYSDRPVIEMRIIGAWESDIERIVSVEADGHVTIVTDRSVLSSTDDFTSMTLTPRGHERLAERLDETGVFDLAEQLPHDSGRVGPDEANAKMTIDGFETFTVNEYRADDPTTDRVRRAALDAVAVVSDLSWLEASDIKEPLGPWIPYSMEVSARAGVAARSGLPTPTNVADWPYPRSISEMADGTGSNAYDEPTLELCLRGADVEALFSMLDGRNHAYLPVMNEGSVWELNVTPNIPGTSRPDC